MKERKRREKKEEERRRRVDALLSATSERELACCRVIAFYARQGARFRGFSPVSRRCDEDFMMTRAGRGEEKHPRGEDEGGVFSLHCALFFFSERRHRRRPLLLLLPLLKRQVLLVVSFSYLSTLENQESDSERALQRSRNKEEIPL